jgi:hypothetical protein
MADEKNETLEESKWWIDRGPVKEREKPLGPVPGIIEKWAYELLRGYNQDQAAKNLVDINSRLLKELTVASGEWGYFSMDVGTYPPEKLAKIKNGLPLPAGARGLIVDAGALSGHQFYRCAGTGLLGGWTIGPRAGFLKRRRGAQENSRRLTQVPQEH